MWENVREICTATVYGRRCDKKCIFAKAIICIALCVLIINKIYLILKIII